MSRPLPGLPFRTRLTDPREKLAHNARYGQTEPTFAGDDQGVRLLAGVLSTDTHRHPFNDRYAGRDK